MATLMIENRATAHLKITVSALTRKRPEMVNDLLDSWQKMDLPENCDVSCLIVENDETPLTEELVESRNPLHDNLPLHYVLEIEPGIPFGRNRAAKVAIEQGSDILIFVDDDEIVAKDWLVKLIAGFRKSRAILCGAPVRIAPPLPDLNWYERLMHENIVGFRKRREIEFATKGSINYTGFLTIATNNWIAETRLFSEEGIWFDEEMRFTGGTDKKLGQETKVAGLAVGWIKDAFVYETMPKERCKFSYQYRRFRDQTITDIQRRIATEPKLHRQAYTRLPKDIISVIFCILTMPLAINSKPLKLANKLGLISGRFGAIKGKRSELYAQITGG